MRCPNCNRLGFQYPSPCPHCQFQDTTKLAQELAHVEWLLDEVDTWGDILGRKSRQRVQQKYTGQKRELEIALGLRLPPFTPEEAQWAWPQLIQFETLLQKLSDWSAAGLLNPAVGQVAIAQARYQIEEFQEQLAGHARPTIPRTPADQLKLTTYLLKVVEVLEQNGGFVTPQAHAQARDPLLARQKELEIKLGLRPDPEKEKVEKPAVPTPKQIQTKKEPPAKRVEPKPSVPPAPDTEPEPVAPAPPPKPRVPFRERLWQMLLSERTLQAMLFLGIFLLFAAALSFVAWGWKDFSAPLRVAIPTGFTGIFFGLGWYVRKKTPMYRSGIALSAIASLLIPIDFYTIYVNFNIPADFWPAFWLITSAFCLVTYIIAGLIIRSRFFGYVVGTAAGSTVLALIELGHQIFGLSLDWRSSGLSLLALGLIVLATTLTPPKAGQRHPLTIFADPFRYLSLLTITVVMLFTFGWRFLQRDTYDTLHYALTLNWWLGGFIFGWGAIQYRSRGLGLLAAITLPVATYLAQAAIFNQVGINPAWHAFGWALLTPLYFIVGYRLLTHKNDPVLHSHGRGAVRWGAVLLGVAALWSLTDLSSGAAAASSHAVLAGSVVLATLLWRRPAYLYGASILSFSATNFALTEFNLTIAQLSVGWASLAIVHIIVAVNLGTRFPIPAPNLAGPLVNAGYLIAAAATLPTLFPFDGNLLAYALGNWLALAGWGAKLAHTKQPGFVGRGIWRKPLFHWFTVIPLPIWLWIVFTNVRPLDWTVPPALALLAWAMVLLSYRLAGANSAYRYPWSLTGGLVSVGAPVAAFVIAPNGFTPGVTLLLVGLLYFADAATRRQGGELVPAGLVTAWGYVFILNRLQFSTEVVSFGQAMLVAFYILVGLWAERKKSAIFTRQFFTPLYIISHFLMLTVLAQVYLPVLNRLFFNTVWAEPARLWGAATQFLLAAVYGLYAWGTLKEKWGHLAAWLAAAGCGFVLITFSPTNESIVAGVALVAIAFVLAERGLYQLRRNPVAKSRQRAFIRLTWRLFKRPLLVAGWAVSAGVIGLSPLYNLWGLGGSRAAQIWATVALLLITALYGVSARLFRQPRFAWLAALLSFAPWTILANLNWFIPAPVGAAVFTLSWALLGWVLFLVHLRLRQLHLKAYASAPKAVMHGLLPLTIVWSVIYFTPSSYIQALGLLAIGLLYFAEAVINKHSIALAPGALVTGWGYLTLLARFNLSFDELGFALALLSGFYILVGLWVERRQSAIFTQKFLGPLYLAAHALTLGVLWQVYVRPFDRLLFGVSWTDEMRLWGAAGQLVLGIVYGCYAWGTFKERWGHFAAWLITFSGAFIAISYSTGQGSSAAQAALGAIVFVLAERGLRWAWRNWEPGGQRRQQAFIRLTWRLFKRPLLVTGWTVSGAAIGLALIRNLWLLGDGSVQKIWAVTALWLVIGLYALSARLFRQARFVWLAAPLTFVPWTILTNLGWFSPYRPTLPGYALSWMFLAWGLLLLALVIRRHAPAAYGLPLKLIAHLLVPFSLLWGIANVDTSRFTFGLAIGFYILTAILNHRQAKAVTNRLEVLQKTKFFYPALGLIPIWCIYLMVWLLPTAHREHFGLMLVAFGPLGLAVGQWLYRIAPQQKAAGGYGLPAYSTGFASLSVGTILVAHQPALLALVLLFNALLMLVSARLFKKPVWVYLAAALAPISLLLALQETAIPMSRYGWWLIGLASIYLIATWTLRRINLAEFGIATLMTAFVLIALGLPPSSLDRSGALWGYGSAAVLYAITAFWLRQPLLLTPASGLAVVPYAIILLNSSLAPQFHGPALFPGAVAALGLGWMLDYRLGAWRNFPWGDWERWFQSGLQRWAGWWALPLYVVGFGLAIVSPFFTLFRSGLIALTFLGMMPLFGWAVYRFRLRGWLVATTVAGHFAAFYYLDAQGWWQHPDLAQAWLRFLPVTLIMGGITLFIERYRNESTPVRKQVAFTGWSHPLYLILLFDVTMGQILSMGAGSSTAAYWVTLAHTGLIAVLASFWLSKGMIYLSVSLGLVALFQWVMATGGLARSLAVMAAQLALAYGLVGYGLALVRDSLDRKRELRPWLAIWELPLQRFSIGLSLGTLVLTGLLGLDLVGWTVRAMLGIPFRYIVDVATVQMVVGVLGFIGLLYVAASVTHQWLRLGYVATGMLLTSWSLYVFYIQAWDDLRQVQWYAMPVGLYLLGIAYMEWQREHKTFARRLDYLAMVLMLGSLFWQTLLFGWGYAILLGSEGLAALFWGSGRRLRRFLYAGMVGVILATVGQLLNSLRSINQWIVFGIIGLLLVLVAVVVERKLEDIKSWQEILETWE